MNFQFPRLMGFKVDIFRISPIVKMFARDVTIFSREKVSVVFFIYSKCCNTMLTYPFSESPLHPLTYNETGIYKEITYSSYITLKHRLWVLVRTATLIRF